MCDSALFSKAEEQNFSSAARYFIQQTPLVRSSAIYAPALCAAKQGTESFRCILKQFYPEKLQSHIEADAYGVFGLKASSEFFSPEWRNLHSLFLRELELNGEILARRTDIPSVFPISSLHGRSDLYVIHSEDSIALDDFAAMRRPQTLTDDYLALCLSITDHLLHSVAAIHEVCLHLNITPKTVYITPGGCPPEHLTVSSAFSVSLLDLSAARKREELRLPCAGFSLYLNGTYTRGYSDTYLRDALTMSSCFSETDDYLIKYPIDERSDLFSIAAVAYFLITGYSPRTDCETFSALLPSEGPLLDPLLRQQLEDLLSAALRLSSGYAQAESALSEFAEELYTIQQQL